MPDDPVHIGELSESDVVRTDDGPMLRIRTDQGVFLLSASEKAAVDGLAIAADMFACHDLQADSDDESGVADHA